MSLIHRIGKVSIDTTIDRTYNMPPGGLVQVSDRQPVRALEILATVDRPQKRRIIDLAESLQTDQESARLAMNRFEGDRVEEGETLATRRRFLSALKAASPIKGRIVSITGARVLVEGESEYSEILAPTAGIVVDLELQQYVTIRTRGVIFQLAWGYGKSAWGVLKFMRDLPAEGDANNERFSIEQRGTVIAVIDPITPGLLKELEAVDARALIAPSMPASLVPRLADLPFPVGLTQGFGRMVMDPFFQAQLNRFNGQSVSLAQSPASDWRETQAEIIIPIESAGGQSKPEQVPVAYEPGHVVRIWQAPHTGVIAQIESIPATPYPLENGLWLPGAVVTLPEQGGSLYVPFANLEFLGA